MRIKWVPFILLVGVAVITFTVIQLDHKPQEVTQVKAPSHSVETNSLERPLETLTNDDDDENIDSGAVQSSTSFILNDHVQRRADYFAHGFSTGYSFVSFGRWLMREQFNTSLPFFASPKFGIVVANNTCKNSLCYMTDNGGLDWNPIEQQLRGKYGDVK